MEVHGGEVGLELPTPDRRHPPCRIGLDPGARADADGDRRAGRAYSAECPGDVRRGQALLPLRSADMQMDSTGACGDCRSTAAASCSGSTGSAGCSAGHLAPLSAAFSNIG